MLHINTNRLLNTFTLRDKRSSKEMLAQMCECSTVFELKEKYPDTYNTIFRWIFSDSDYPSHLKEILLDSESFYKGYYSSIILNNQEGNGF